MLYTMKGDLIDLAKKGTFDVIGHGCNCFCTMKKGIAQQMADAFGCDRFVFEEQAHGDIEKLGRIDYMYVNHENKNIGFYSNPEKGLILAVVNMYTQYHWSQNSRFGLPIDYTALELCLVKMNHVFKGKHIGLPRIGCGEAKGDWSRVLEMIRTIMVDCDVTIVILE